MRKHFAGSSAKLQKVPRKSPRQDRKNAVGGESLNKNMNFLYNYPSENRTEFTKLKVACKYASIERGCAYT